MAQRLVDTVDHEDAEHDFSQLAYEDVLGWTMNPATDVGLRMDSQSVLSAAAISLTFGYARLISWDDCRGTRLELQRPMQNSQLGMQATGFRQNTRPTITVEDLAIIDNVAGI